MASKMTRKDYLKGTAGGLLSLALLSKLGMSAQAAPVTDNLHSNGSGAGGGSTVEWNQLQDSGDKIAEITIDGATTGVFAPFGSNIGGGFKSDILYTNTDSTSRSDIELSRPYTDYDYLDVTVLKCDADTSYDFIHTYIDCKQQKEITENTLFSGRVNTNIFDVWARTNSYFRYKFIDETHLVYPSGIFPAEGAHTIYQIKGVKLGFGGNGFEIRTMKYVGTGGNLELDVTGMNFILGIFGHGLNGTDVSIMPLSVDSCGFTTIFRYPDKTSGGMHQGLIERIDNMLIFKGACDDGGRCNIIGEEYTVYYM